MKINKQLILIGTLFFSVSSTALESDYDKPIHVSSVQQHAKMQENTVVFSKDVLLTQGSIKITSAKLTAIRGEQANQEVMVADGAPATFYQTQNDGKPLNARANSIRYDVATGKITLTGNAQVKQLDSQINASKMVYFLKTKELIVGAGKTESDRVNTVFLPAQFEKDKQDTNKKSTAKEEE